MKHLMGSALILVSAAGFGSMAIFAHTAYADGVDTASLLAIRFVLAAIVLTVWVRIKGIAMPTGKELRGYIVMGCIYAATSFGYFQALNYASSATVALLLYTFPIMVTIASAILGLDRFGPAEWIALTGIFVGMVLLLGTGVQATLPGIVLALGAAVLYSGYILLGSRLGGDTHPLAATSTVLLSAGSIYLLMALTKGIHLPHSMSDWVSVSLIALFGSILGIMTFVAGLKLVGPTLAAILSTLEPVVTVILGVSFLGEALGGYALLGGGLILAASIGLAMNRIWRQRQLAT